MSRAKINRIMACSWCKALIYPPLPANTQVAIQRRLGGSPVFPCVCLTFILSQSTPHWASSSWTTPTIVSKQIRPWDVFFPDTEWLLCLGMRCMFVYVCLKYLIATCPVLTTHTFTRAERCIEGWNWTQILNGHNCILSFSAGSSPIFSK